MRELIHRHNPGKDRSDALASEWTRLSAEIEAAEAEENAAEARR